MGPRKKAKLSKKADVKSLRESSAATVPLPASPDSSTKHGTLEEQPEITSTPSSSQSRPFPTGAEIEPTDPTTSRLQKSERTSSSQSTKSWYGGTWPRIPKAAPVTQLAKESLSAVGEVASEVATSACERTQQELTIPFKPPSLYLSHNLGSSSRSLPLSATTTKVHITSSPLNDTERNKKDDVRDNEIVRPDENRSEVEKKRGDGDHKVAVEHKELEATNTAPIDPNKIDESKSQEEVLDRPSGWLSWFSKSENTSSQTPSNPPLPEQPLKNNDTKSLVPEEADIKHPSSDTPFLDSDQRRNSDPNPLPQSSIEGQQRRSWLGYWSRDDAKKNEPMVEPSQSSPNLTLEEYSDNTQNVADSSQKTIPEVANKSSVPSQSSGWAFWSWGNPNNPNEDPAKADIGDLAVAGSSSQSKPETAILDRDKGIPKIPSKSGKPDKLSASSQQKDKIHDVISTSTKSSSAIATSISTATQPPKANATQLKDNAKNLVLPPIKQTYKAPENLNLFQQLGQFLSYTKAPTSKHLSLVKDPPRVKMALAIGVHGYFPAPFIRTVLGQPTGTSIKFAESAANAIRKWTLAHGYSCEVEKVALEGEGKIEERIELLWKLLLNWLDQIRKADFILVACHSQGVPVAMMLVAKLIAFGCVNSARIGICAMAGVSLGPFADYKSRWISGSAGELFEFARPDSKVSKDYEAALAEALEFGVKLLYIGSIDDQLVSLEVTSSHLTVRLI